MRTMVAKHAGVTRQFGSLPMHGRMNHLCALRPLPSLAPGRRDSDSAAVGALRTETLCAYFRDLKKPSPDHTVLVGRGLLSFLAALVVAAAPPSMAASGYSVRSYIDDADEAAAFSNIPGSLQGGDAQDDTPRLGLLIKGKNKEEITQCTRKCVPTCIRGGSGPGLGPLSVRKEKVVFKEGFRSRSYCLSECAQICALEINAKDGSTAKK